VFLFYFIQFIDCWGTALCQTFCTYKSSFNILITQDESLCLHLCAAVGACLYPCWSFSLAHLQWCTHHYCVHLHADTPVPTFGSRVSDYCCSMIFQLQTDMIWDRLSAAIFWDFSQGLLPPADFNHDLARLVLRLLASHTACFAY